MDISYTVGIQGENEKFVRVNLQLLQKDQIWHQSLLQAVHSEVVLRILEIGHHVRVCKACMELIHNLYLDTILDLWDMDLCTHYGYI